MSRIYCHCFLTQLKPARNPELNCYCSFSLNSSENSQNGNSLFNSGAWGHRITSSRHRQKPEERASTRSLTAFSEEV